MRKQSQLTDRRYVSFVERLKHEELRAADANCFLCRSRRDSQRTDEQAQVVEDDAGF
jgi:hypothetical protein